MKRQTGLSLVELMIAVTLGLVLSSAAISAFISVKKVNNTTSGSAGLADSGRFAFDQLGMGLKSAGYLGCSTSSQARVDLSTTLPVLVTDVGEALGGYEYTGTGIGGNFALVTPMSRRAVRQLGHQRHPWGLMDAGVFSASVSGGAIGNPIAGSDAIAMHESPVGDYAGLSNGRRERGGEQRDHDTGHGRPQHRFCECDRRGRLTDCGGRQLPVSRGVLGFLHCRRFSTSVPRCCSSIW